MKVAGIADRIRTQVPANLVAFVGTALDLASAQEGAIQFPAVFVVELGDDAGENERASGRVIQRVEAQIGVVIAMQDLNRLRGERGQDALEDVRAAIRAALLAWEPEAGADPMTFAQGRLLEWNEFALWWQDAYITAHYITG
jgi:hypothetical protein